MNLILRSAVAAAVCATFGSAAQALDRTEYVAATKVYFGGATATDNTLEEVFISTVGGICDVTLGDIDIWRSTNQRVVTCRTSNENTPSHGFAARAAGGTLIAFHKESTGGSSNGVVPLIAVAKGQAHTLRWLDVAQLTDDCTVAAVGATANLAAYTNHTNCTLVQTPVDTAGSATFDIHGGISDNEPKLAFPAPGADAARLLSNPGLAIVFGVPVSTALYRALQVAQFGDGSACDGSDATNCVPSLTRAQLAALYNQNIADWNDFRNAAGTSLTNIAGVTAPTDELVRICRRVASSGTQASFEAYFLNERCVSGVTGFALPDDASTVLDTTYSPSNFASGSLVNAAPSSGNVRTCLAAANTGNFWAIGVHSTEITDSNFNSGNGGFRFIGIDGAAPNLTNVANGDYNFFTENTINRISNTFAGNAGALADGNPRREIVELIDEKLGNVPVLANLNATFDGRPWGNAGLLALSTTSTANTAPYSDAEMSGSPVNTQSRNGNTCGPALMAKPQPINGTPNP